MISDDHLIGWLCFIRLQVQDGITIHVPKRIQSELISRGWMTITPRDGDSGESDIKFTDRAWTLTDLHAPEWGINSIPQEEAT